MSRKTFSSENLMNDDDGGKFDGNISSSIAIIWTFYFYSHQANDIKNFLALSNLHSKWCFLFKLNNSCWSRYRIEGKYHTQKHHHHHHQHCERLGNFLFFFLSNDFQGDSLSSSWNFIMKFLRVLSLRERKRKRWEGFGRKLILPLNHILLVSLPSFENLS